MHVNTTLWVESHDSFTFEVTALTQPYVTVRPVHFSHHDMPVMANSPDALRALGEALYEAADELEDAIKLADVPQEVSA